MGLTRIKGSVWNTEDNTVVDVLADLTYSDREGLMFVSGATATNDGGGGFFKYETAIDRSTADGIDIIDPTGTGIGTGCWIRQLVGSSSDIKQESHVVVNGDTVTTTGVYTMTGISYTPGSNSLEVYVNGVRYVKTLNYLETSSTVVTFNDVLQVGDILLFVVKNTNALEGVDTNDVSYSPATGYSRVLQGKLRESISVLDYIPEMYHDAIRAGTNDVDLSGYIQSALNAGGMIEFPVGFYLIEDSLDITINNTTVFGNATIDCTYTTAGSLSGYGFNVTADNCTIKELTFLSTVATKGSANYIDGRIISLTGNKNKVINCHFTGGNGGAVYVYGDDNNIKGSTFINCNNRSGGGDYGAIFLRSGTGNKFLYNHIEGQFYAGISCYGDNGTGTSLVSDYDIIGNTIIGNTDREFTMGIFALQGANKNIKILDNNISVIGNEGIVIFGDDSSTTEDVLISNNRIFDFNYSGIFINSVSGAYSASKVIISNNILKHNESSTATAYALVTESIKDSTISGNIIEGRTTYGTYTAIGILLQQTGCDSNNISNNVIRSCTTGITFVGTRSQCIGNTIYTATTGLLYDSCQSSSVQNNLINGCTTGLSGGSNTNYTLVTGNMISGCTTDTSNPTGANYNFYGSTQTSEAATRHFSGGTLVAGTKTITFYHISAGDIFIPIPTTTGGTVGNHGSLYIAHIDPTAETITVNSTNAADTRAFVVVKIANATVSA